MKKRLRKKLKIKEYMKRGFRVVIQFDKAQDTSVAKNLVNEFLTFASDKNSLSCGGYSDENQLEMFITTISRVSANERHQSIIEQWLKNRSCITDFTIGKLEKARQ